MNILSEEFCFWIQLIEAANGVTVWLDYTPWLPGYTPPGTPEPIDSTTEAASSIAASTFTIVFASLLGTVIVMY